MNRAVLFPQVYFYVLFLFAFSKTISSHSLFFKSRLENHHAPLLFLSISPSFVMSKTSHSKSPSAICLLYSTTSFKAPGGPVTDAYCHWTLLYDVTSNQSNCQNTSVCMVHFCLLCLHYTLKQL